MNSKGFRWYFDRLMDEFWPAADNFDLARGVNTSGRVWHFRLDIPFRSRREAVTYQPVDPQVFVEAMKWLPLEAHGWPFVDLGCGKGRGLLLAKEAGFEKIIGVEFSPSLAAIARRNVSACPQISVVQGDASKFVFPLGPVVIYMYNPFGPKIIQQVVENARRESVSGYLVYVTPVHDDVLAQHDLRVAKKTGGYSVWQI